MFFFLLAPSPLFCFLQRALLLCGQMTSAGSQISRCPLPAACRAVRHSNRKTHQTRPLMYCQYSNFALLGKDLAKETAVLFGAGPEGKFYVWVVQVKWDMGWTVRRWLLGQTFHLMLHLLLSACGWIWKRRVEKWSWTHLECMLPAQHWETSPLAISTILGLVVTLWVILCKMPWSVAKKHLELDVSMIQLFLPSLIF